MRIRVSQRAMATEFEILLAADAPPSHVEVAVVALDRLESLEEKLTIYDPDSELSRLNAKAGSEAVFVSETLCDVLCEAAHVWRLTEGAFDVTAGPLVEAWGFTKRSGVRPTNHQIEEARALVGWQYVDFDFEARRIQFQRPGMAINLGAVGKGYAIDRLRTELDEAGVEEYLIHGGNSSIFGRGGEPARELESSSAPSSSGETGASPREPSSDESLAGWKIGLQHPQRARQRLGGVLLRNAALGTSGSGKQYFHHQGKRLGHVLDPRSGYPVDHFASLSVVTDRCACADALATGLFVAGEALIERLTGNDPELAVITAEATGRQGEMHVQCWNADSIWKLLPTR